MNVLPFVILTLAASAAHLQAQQLREGYASSVHSLAPSAGNVLVLPGDRFVFFDGTDLWLEAPGQPQRSLLNFAAPVFGSMTIQVDTGHVLFGESSTHGMWLVPLQGPAPSQPVATVAFSYDAVLYAPGQVLLSAKPGGFSAPQNDLIHVDLPTGNVRLVAQLPGASGPLAVAPNGDIYYATASLAWPTPAGQVTVLRFPRAIVDQALASMQVLGAAHAQVVTSGLDAAGAMAFDDHGDLHFTDWFNNTVGTLHDATGSSPWRTNLLDHTGSSVGAVTLQFVGSSASGVFEPFQPANGELHVHESAWQGPSQVRAVRARRPALSSSAPNPVPSGPFSLQVANGPSLGFGLVAIGFGPAVGGAPLLVPGFRQPLWWDSALGAAFAVTFVPFDGSGNAQLGLHNPGAMPPVAFLVQAAFVDAGASTVGTTSPQVLQLGP